MMNRRPGPKDEISGAKDEANYGESSFPMTVVYNLSRTWVESECLERYGKFPESYDIFPWKLSETFRGNFPRKLSFTTLAQAPSQVTVRLSGRVLLVWVGGS